MDWTVSWFAVFLIGVARAAMEAARQECPQIVTEYMLTTYRVCNNVHDNNVNSLVNPLYVPDSTFLSCHLRTSLNEIRLQKRKLFQKTLNPCLNVNYTEENTGFMVVCKSFFRVFKSYYVITDTNGNQLPCLTDSA